MRRGPVLAGSLAALAGLVLSACAGVPSSSRPQVVGRVTGGVQAASPASTPEPGAQPREIVQGFLDNNASTDQHHTAARAYLTSDTASRWVDSTVTVIGSEVVGNFDPASGTVTVTGMPLATINADGVYTRNQDVNGPSTKYIYTMRKVNGQWRIANLPAGVVITTDDLGVYKPASLYFYDSDQHLLVQDQRYTSRVGYAQRATWLVQEMVAGPNPSLQNAVITEVPSQLAPSSVTVAVGSTIDVTMPGVAALSRQTVDLLAAQVAYTLRSANELSGQELPKIRLIDGRPQTIPQLRRATFTADDFPDFAGTPQSAALYYLSGGRLVDSTGTAVPGRVGNGSYHLQSVAVAGISGTSTLRVAGVITQNGVDGLWIGTQTGGLSETHLRGPLTRPTWAPGRNEVWVGSGAQVWMARSPTSVVPVALQVLSGARITGAVRAVRFSPDGVRIAMVVAGPHGNGQVWVGSVERSGNAVTVDGLAPITPDNVDMVDVAWNDPLRLYAIGRVGSADDGDLYRFLVDGSQFTSSAITGLPQAPDTVTASNNAPVWVSAGESVWEQLRSDGPWQSPGSTGDGAGVGPVYQE